MATFKLPVWHIKTNRKVAKSVHQTRAATVADNFESHKNKVSDCGSGLLAPVTQGFNGTNCNHDDHGTCCYTAILEL